MSLFFCLLLRFLSLFLVFISDVLGCASVFFVIFLGVHWALRIDQLLCRRSGFSSLRAGLFDVGVRQGLPLPPLHTRAHAHTHTRTRTTLCRQGSGGSKVTDSLSPAPPHPFSRAYILSCHILARALSSIPARAGEHRAEAGRFPSMPPS